MDAATLTAFLLPFLPFLMKMGDKATEAAAVKLGEDTWHKAKLIWAKLRPAMTTTDVQDAAEKVVAKPDSEARQSVLQEELAALLAENRDLATTIAQIMRGASDVTLRPQVMQNVTGNQNQIIGQAHGSQVFGSVAGNVSFGASNPTSGVGSGTATARTAPAKTILILAANPKGTPPLRLDEEVREIQQGLERASQRDQFVLQQRWAVSPKEVQRVLLDCKPNIVHFCGHGIGASTPASESPTRKALLVSAEHREEGLMFEDSTGQPQLVPSQALSSLFSLFAHEVECVVLNACYSEAQATAIAQHISYVVGMNRAIGDRSAIAFAIGF